MFNSCTALLDIFVYWCPSIIIFIIIIIIIIIISIIIVIVSELPPLFSVSSHSHRSGHPKG